MKLKRFLISLMLIVSILVSSPSAEAVNENDLIRQMMNYYCHYQEDGMSDIDRILQELEDVDADLAAQWRVFMKSWNYANTKLDFTNDTLPNDLPKDDSLCLVVMGYQLAAGGKMQDELLCRLKIALTAAQQYPNAYIMVTGGATGSGSNASEAEQMASWLMYKGISPERIIQEKLSFSTEENAINCIKILKSDYPQVRHLALITSDYHMLRSHLVFTARQASVGGDIIDVVAHACYDTPNGTGMSYTNQAELISMMTGVVFKQTDAPKLSTLTGLRLSGETTFEAGQKLGVIATAEYDTGFSCDVTDRTEFTGYDPANVGTQVITASFTDNGITMTDTVGIEIIPSSTTAPVETQPETAPIAEPTAQTAPAAAETEAAAEAEKVAEPTEDVPEEDRMFQWLKGIAVVLVIILLVIIYELRQQYLRVQRRKRRKRKKMNLE